jgi:Zn finger protein HypA/HybF involved in hydrogenase expression
MLQVRCQKCGWNYTLSRDAINTIMEEIKESKPTHYMVDCPKCRHAIKVQTRRLARFYRPPAPEAVDQGSPSDV